MTDTKVIVNLESAAVTKNPDVVESKSNLESTTETEKTAKKSDKTEPKASPKLTAATEIIKELIPVILIVMGIFSLLQIGNWFIPHKEVHDEVVYLFDKGDAMVLWLSPLHHEKEITIPTEIQGRKVTQIRSKAFKKAYWVEHISIPDKVQFVEEDMFWNSIDVTIYPTI